MRNLTAKKSQNFREELSEVFVYLGEAITMTRNKRRELIANNPRDGSPGRVIRLPPDFTEPIMKTNILTRVSKIGLAACLALVLGISSADASHYGYGQGYSQPQYSPRSYSGYGQGYGQRSYSPSQYGGGYNRAPQHCQPQYRPQPQYGYQGGYR